CSSDFTKDRMVDVLSSIFVTDPHIVTKIGRFARFYGPSGENGKSTLIKLIEESIGFENVGAFKTHDFKEYKIASAIDSLLIVDDDEQGRRIPEESSANIKSTITDRKSTRLNSSHVSISYAVFCLKKKQ